MEFIINGLDAYQTDRALLKPTGFIKSSKTFHDVYPIVTNIFSIKLCSNKNSLDVATFERIDFKALGTLFAMERSFTSFLGYLINANKGAPESNTPLEVRDFYRLQKNGNVNEFRSYTKALNKQIIWKLMSVNWSKDSESIRKLHDFIIKVIHCNFGWRMLTQSEQTDFICGPLSRADGPFELEQLNILQNLIQHICMSIVQTQPLLSNFFYSHRLITKGPELWIEIETVQALRFRGLSKVVKQFFEGRRDFVVFKLIADLILKNFQPAA